MRSLMRSYDAVGRYGGEEFLIVLPGCDEEKAATTAERIRSHIDSNHMDTTAGMIPVTVSLGVAAYFGEGKCDVYTLVQRADSALYRAKEKGRNRVEIAM
jgi:two-component system cell cycle response regulator